ncbi:ribosomal protein S20 [Artemisia annua]|uniref:Ribosomal protein S20 n=1 Tax=Artemisia annua TaxID=35608 RepID=A0A2U1LJX3_ARTAN|nr:ribosomal protein S20 [Artemisia annua]
MVCFPPFSVTRNKQRTVAAVTPLRQFWNIKCRWSWRLFTSDSWVTISRKLTDLHFEQELGQDFDRDTHAKYLMGFVVRLQAKDLVAQTALSEVCSLPSETPKIAAQPEEVIGIEKLIADAYSVIDKANQVGTLHRNTGARRKSRLARRKEAVEVHRGWYTPQPTPAAVV